MLEIHDYSNRRGVLVPLLPKIHALLKETAEKETLAAFEPPEHIILWKQTMHKKLVEIHRRWLMVLDGPALAGFMFFHFGRDKNIYLDEIRTAWAYRHNKGVFTLLHDRFINDPHIKSKTDITVYGGVNIRREANQEILASVGFEQTFENNLEPLGSPSEAAAILKLRYLS
jgi:hypothetical protein